MPQTRPSDQAALVDLAAGLGGFHIPFENLDGRAVFAAEWDPTLNDLYRDGPWLQRSRLWELSSSLQKFEWSAQGGASSVENYGLQIGASCVRVKRTNTAPNLIAMAQTQVPILGSWRPYMTSTGRDRQQRLDSVQLPRRDLHAYRAVGNAVNAKVVKENARPLIASLSATLVAAT